MPVVEITTITQLTGLKSVIYSAIFLTPGSQHQLLSWFELFPEIKAHYIMLEFKPNGTSNLERCSTMYEEWLYQLDLEIQFRAGVRLMDIPAWIDPAWYKDGISIEEVADKLLKQVYD